MKTETENLICLKSHPASGQRGTPRASFHLSLLPAAHGGARLLRFMGSRCPAEASRTEDPATAEGDSLAEVRRRFRCRRSLCNSPRSSTGLHLSSRSHSPHSSSSGEPSGRFTSKSFIRFISLSHSVGTKRNIAARDRFLGGRAPGCAPQPWNPPSFSQHTLKRRKSSSGLRQPLPNAAGRARLRTPVKHLQFLLEIFLIYNFL